MSRQRRRTTLPKAQNGGRGSLTAIAVLIVVAVSQCILAEASSRHQQGRLRARDLSTIAAPQEKNQRHHPQPQGREQRRLRDKVEQDTSSSSSSSLDHEQRRRTQHDRIIGGSDVPFMVDPSLFDPSELEAVPPSAHQRQDEEEEEGRSPYPWFAALYYESCTPKASGDGYHCGGASCSVFCGGVVIGSQWLLTATHCVTTAVASEKRKFYGWKMGAHEQTLANCSDTTLVTSNIFTKRNKKNESSATSSTMTTISTVPSEHDFYKYKTYFLPESERHDLALVQLDRPMNGTRGLFREARPDNGTVVSELNRSSVLTAIGLGRVLDADSGHFTRPEVLQQVDLFLEEQEDCQAKWDTHPEPDLYQLPTDPLSFVCTNRTRTSSESAESEPGGSTAGSGSAAASPKPQSGTTATTPHASLVGVCNGDSGGPLFVGGKNGEDAIIVGITSQGAGCQDTYPDVYARVGNPATYPAIESLVCGSRTSTPPWWCPARYLLDPVVPRQDDDHNNNKGGGMAPDKPPVCRDNNNGLGLLENARAKFTRRTGKARKSCAWLNHHRKGWKRRTKYCSSQRRQSTARQQCPITCQTCA